MLSVLEIISFSFWYHISPDTYYSFAAMIIQFIFTVVLYSFVILRLRRHAGGYWRFWQAFTHIYITCIPSQIFVALFIVGFARFIDPSFSENEREANIRKTEWVYKKFGAEGRKLNEMMAKSKKNDRNDYHRTVGGTLTDAILTIFLILLPLAMLLAAIFKKNRPLYILNDQFDKEQSV